MRLRQRTKMIALLVSLLLVISFGLANKKDNIQEDVPNDDAVIDTIPETYKGLINDKYNVPTDIINVITNYMDAYFKSIYTLELQDTKDYFVNELDGQVSDAAIKLIVETRKLYDFDFTMSDAHYDLNIINYSNSGDKYYVDFLEDDYFCFKFLNGISSETYDVENYIVIEKVNDEYKISEYEKVQGYYMMFNDNKDDGEIESVYQFYYDRLKATIEDELYKKQLAQTNPYVANKVFNVKYDRDAAAKYANSYYHTRNEEYYDFSDEGGNCQNFASQTLKAGGMIMDDSGDCNWYYYDHLDYVPSWVHVSSFYDYCRDNEGTGLATDINNNIYYAELGDLIQVGISSISHTTIVSKVVDGHILLNSNSIDMKDFPLEAYTYPTRKLIKILGSNN